MRAAAPRARKAGGKKSRRQWVGSALRWIVAGTAAFYIFFGICFLYLRWLPPLTTGVQAQRRVQALFGRKMYHKRYEWVTLTSISTDLQHAVVAAEDARFYEHHGIDWKEVSKIAEESIEEGEVTRGGSTITQQLVKNLFLTTSRSPIRKAMEFALVPEAELLLPKQRILELYLNVIEWGPGVFGAQAAAGFHYNVTAARLSREQAARLAAIIPAPNRRKLNRMGDYSNKILNRMRRMGW